MRMRWVVVAVMSVGLVGCLVARAQEAGGPGAGMRGQFANMPRVSGEVTAVDGMTVTVKGENGTTYQVVTTDNTRIMKGNGQMRGMGDAQTIKVSELKAGDGLVAMGQMEDATKTLHAAMVFATDAAVVKALKANLGKTYITGKVAAIDLDNAKLTVERPDGVSQVIGLDENTSFKRGRGRMGMGGGAGAPGGGGGVSGGGAPAGGESITLADVKVGDQVIGQGSMKAGTFVPTQLNVMTPRPKPAQ